MLIQHYHNAALQSQKVELFTWKVGIEEPSKNKTFLWHLYNVGPTSSTLVQHCINVIQMFCVDWEWIAMTISSTPARYFPIGCPGSQYLIGQVLSGTVKIQYLLFF